MLELIVSLSFCHNVLKSITRVHIYYISYYKESYISINVNSLLILKCINYFEETNTSITNIKNH